MLVGTVSSIDYVVADYEFGYFVGYNVDFDSFDCLDNNCGNFDGLDDILLVR